MRPPRPTLDMHQLALAGARIRLAAILSERDAIFERFPDLAQRNAAQAAARVRTPSGSLDGGRRRTALVPARTPGTPRVYGSDAPAATPVPPARPVVPLDGAEDAAAHRPSRTRRQAAGAEADEETRRAMHAILRDGLRDRLIPRERLDVLEESDDFRAALLLALGDLGIVVDDESPVGAAPPRAADDPAEEALIDEAMAFISAVTAAEGDPLHIYRRDARTRARSIPEAEIGREMRLGMEQALDGLARWPAGLSALLHVLDQRSPHGGPAGAIRPDGTLTGEARDAPAAADEETDSQDDGVLELAAGQGDAGGWQGEPAGATDARALVEALRALVSGTAGLCDGARADAVRGVLSRMSPSRALLESIRKGAGPGERELEGYLAMASGLDRALDAWRQMTESKLSLVVFLARRYAGHGLPLPDLVQEGNIGLMTAAAKFDHRRGVRLSTYARAWIIQAVTRAISNTARVIRLPVYLLQRIELIAAARDALERRLGRDPDEAELAAFLHLTPLQIGRADAAGRDVGCLDAPSPLHPGLGLDECLADPGETPEDRVIRLSIGRGVSQLLKTLRPREAEVLRRRFGLDGTDGWTLEQIARVHGLTRERIRQIEASALKKLRSSWRQRFARALLGGAATKLWTHRIPGPVSRGPSRRRPRG